MPSEWWILVLLCQWIQLGLSFDLGTSAPGVGPIRILDLLGLVEPIADSMSALPTASPTLPIDRAIPASMRAPVKLIAVYCAGSS